MLPSHMVVCPKELRHVRLNTSDTEVKRIGPLPPYEELPSDSLNGQEMVEAVGGVEPRSTTAEEGREREHRRVERGMDLESESTMDDHKTELQQKQEECMTLDEWEEYARKLHKLYMKIICMFKRYQAKKLHQTIQQLHESFAETKWVAKRKRQQIMQILAITNKDDEMTRENGLILFSTPWRY